MTLYELRDHLIEKLEASAYINNAYYDWLQEIANDPDKTTNYPIFCINPIPITGERNTHWETYIITGYLLEAGHDQDGNRLSKEQRDLVWSNQKAALDAILPTINTGDGVSVERYRMDADEFQFNDLAISTKLELTLSVWNKRC